MPRRLRPMRRWISTERPSGRPLLTSRRLRSLVEAGSIPYSAVTQPRPEPARNRGTDSSTDAVQITRVSPAEMRADPVAVRTKQASRFAPPVRVRGAPSCRGGLALEVDVHDVVERHLEEPRTQFAEAVHVSRAQEAVVAFFLLRV